MLASCNPKEEIGEAKAVGANESYVVFAATGAPSQTLSVYADGSWAVDVNQPWIQVSPMTGQGMGSITVSVADNATGGVIDSPREGTIILQGRFRERRMVITVHQNGDNYYGVEEQTLAQVAALDDDAYAKVPDAQVVALSQNGFIAADESASLYVQGTGPALGDKLSFNGKKISVNGAPAFEMDEFQVNGNSAVVYPEAKDITASLDGYDPNVTEYLSLSASLVGTTIWVNSNVQIPILDPLESLELGAMDLHKVVFKGYGVGTSMLVVSAEDGGMDEALIPYPLRFKVRVDGINYTSATWSETSRIQPVQGLGYIEYVPFDLENTDGNNKYKLDVSDKSPRVTGPWPGDYWLFYGNGAIKAGSEVRIAFEARTSATGHKFWLLEFLDGDQWRPACETLTTNETGEEITYSHAMNADGATNVKANYVVKYRKNSEHAQFRFRCLANWQASGAGPLEKRNGGSARLTVTDVTDETYQPLIEIVKEGNGVEKDPVYANIQVDPELLTFNGTPGAPKELMVVSDYDWTISTAYDWLHLDVEGGVAGEETTVTVTCDESELPELREGTIRIVSEDSERVVHVVQSAAGQMLDPFISIVNGNEREVGYEAGEAIIRVQGNVDVEAETAEPWLTIAPADTRALVEWTEFKLTYEENTAEQTPRTGVVRFYNTEKKLESILTVTQAGAPASGVYFQDDFEWLEPWAAYTQDDVANNSVFGSSPNVFTKTEVAGALTEFQNRGYGYIWGWQNQDWSDGLPDNGNKQTMYLMHNYLKFGKTSYNSGIILPALSKINGTDNVELSFDWCWCMTGGAKPDVMTLTVTVTGGGVLADTKTEVSGNIESAQPTEGDQTRLEWQHAKVVIVGATPSTRITIRPTNNDPSVTSTRKQNRWYLDNVRVEKTDYAPVQTEFFADDFEWLEPWAAYTVDDVADNSVANSSPNAFTKAEVAGALTEFQSRGYGYIWGWKGQDWSDGLPDNGNKQTLYLMHNYLKFGKTSYNSGIILPALSKISGSADVDLTFDWCWCMTGKSKPDVMTLTVTVTGGGRLADTGTEVSGNIESAQPTEGDLTKLEWQHATVRILGATPSTRITIRPTNTDPGVSNSARNQNRWYLDNLRVAGE